MATWLPLKSLVSNACIAFIELLLYNSDIAFEIRSKNPKSECTEDIAHYYNKYQYYH